MAPVDREEARHWAMRLAVVRMVAAWGMVQAEARKVAEARMVAAKMAMVRMVAAKMAEARMVVARMVAAK